MRKRELTVPRINPTTSERLTALEKYFGSRDKLQAALHDLWVGKDGTRIALKIDAVYHLYDKLIANKENSHVV